MTVNTPALTLDQAKQRAYALKSRMTELGNTVSMAHAYELVATSCGYRNWPTMKAALVSTVPKPGEVPPTITREYGEIDRLVSEVRERAHDVDKSGYLLADHFPAIQLQISSITRALDALADKLRGRAHVDIYPVLKSTKPLVADKLLDDAELALLQIFQICNGDYSDYENVEWSHKEDGQRFEALTRHAISLKVHLQKLRMPLFQPRRWHPRGNLPTTGGLYVVGGYVQHLDMPPTFEIAFASFRMTVDGAEWVHQDDRKKQLPIEYWTELGPHPSHPESEPRHLILIERDKLLSVCGDLEEVRKQVFGDVGDEPSVYDDYDELCRLASQMRSAIRTLNRSQIGPDVTA